MDRFLVGSEYASHLTDAGLGLLAAVPGRFRQARRVLSHVTDQYLFPSGNPRFARPGC